MDFLLKIQLSNVFQTSSMEVQLLACLKRMPINAKLFAIVKTDYSNSI